MSLPVETQTKIPKYETEKHYLFETFYHPYVCEFIRQLKRHGVDGLLNPAGTGVWKPRQAIFKKYFHDDYDPVVPTVGTPYPLEDVDFTFAGSYSQYNWELFFHVPLLIADRLSKNQHFEEAQQWYHYIFKPIETDGESPERFWMTKPFYENSNAQKSIQDLMKELNDGDSELANQVSQWQTDPFKPHLIARMRRTPYQKTTVMKYIDNLIAWGDQLFQR